MVVSVAPGPVELQMATFCRRRHLSRREVPNATNMLRLLMGSNEEGYPSVRIEELTRKVVAMSAPLSGKPASRGVRLCLDRPGRDYVRCRWKCPGQSGSLL